ncbi:MAG: gamma-glutamylcyclotransferase family protein [Planctomycetota bacterium]|nr:gamma-glutamylcyclotransferase family protein [Planctomycetota bacterium]
MSGPAPYPRRELLVFVYGTLKEGFRNHQRYCHGVIEVAPARVWGRFHEWAEGIPILDVPNSDILFLGSSDVESDLAGAEELLTRPGPDLRLRRRLSLRWRLVHGELLRFPDPRERLTLLDALEGFHPSTGGGYARVLLPVVAAEDDGTRNQVVAAWTYVVPPGERPPGRPWKTTVWEHGRR